MDNFHIIALPHSGYGDSDYPQTGYDPDTLTVEQQAQVIEFINTLRPFHQRECVEHVRRNVPYAKIVEIIKGHHYCFIKHEERVFDEMSRFLME